MDQNFPLMGPLVPMLFKRKILTNRALKPPYFRRKCNVGDKMRFYKNNRTPEQELVGIGIVIETAEWNIDDIPLDIIEAKEKQSPKKGTNWVDFSWYDGFDHYNKNDLLSQLKLTEDALEFQLRDEFIRTFNKNAIWRGKETKAFQKWKLLRIPNFVDYFTNHKKEVKEFKMFTFKEYKNPLKELKIMKLKNIHDLWGKNNYE